MAAVSAPEARARGLGVVVVGGGGLGSSLQHTLQIDRTTLVYCGCSLNTALSENMEIFVVKKYFFEPKIF